MSESCRTTRRRFLRMLGAGAGAMAAPGMVRAVAKPQAAGKPNFVIIFCDDLGYGDVGCYGSKKHRTPNLDKMAAEGVRFTDFYVTSGVCTPSRSSLMTGCYPKRIGMHQNETNAWVLFPANRKGLNPSEITIAEALKKQGYATACVGKWHLGDHRVFLPTRQGFDSYFGIPYSNDMGHSNKRRNYPPLPLLRDEKVIETEPDQAQLTQRYTAEAVTFITANQDRPFFLYLPHTMPHNPVNASERFKGRSANKLYGDSVEEIDWSCGEILKTIKKLGLDERTMVLFTSDNGAASAWGGGNAPLRGFKGSTWEGGMREPAIFRWPGTIPAGKLCKELACSMDMMPTLAKLAGGAAPSDRVIDGKDIWPLISLQAGATTPHEAFFYYYRDQLQAVRSGKWKLHLPRTEKPRGKNKPVQRPAQLYDLRADIAESTNVADKHPDVVQRLVALAKAHEKELAANSRKPGMVDKGVPLT